MVFEFCCWSKGSKVNMVFSFSRSKFWFCRMLSLTLWLRDDFLVLDPDGLMLVRIWVFLFCADNLSSSRKGEVQVLDYVNQQYRLLPLVAMAHAFMLTGSWMNRLYQQSSPDNPEELQEVLKHLRFLPSHINHNSKSLQLFVFLIMFDNQLSKSTTNFHGLSKVCKVKFRNCNTWANRNVRTLSQLFQSFPLRGMRLPLLTLINTFCSSFNSVWEAIYFSDSRKVTKRLFYGMVKMSTDEQEPTVAGQRNMDVLCEKVNAHLPQRSTLKSFGFFQTFRANALLQWW